MGIERREFLRTAGLATVAGLLPGMVSCDDSSREEQPTTNSSKEPGSYVPEENRATEQSWEEIRQQFKLDPDYIHMAGLLLASHPTPVQEAIEEHRRNLNENPVLYVQDNFSDEPDKVRTTAGNYLGVYPHEIALTDSTTMGTALIINGVHLRADQEILSAEWDYYSTHKSAEFKAQRSGASFRKAPIYKDIQNVTAEEIVDNIIDEIRPQTRLLTGTWVHSSTGLRIPAKMISDRLAEVNSGRDPADRVLFFLDGVHGLGVEDTNLTELGCDFFSAGTHKWMFAPRGTGIIWGNSRAHDQITPTIPTFTNGAGWGGKMTPGGFKPFEHQWAMAEAFNFHMEMGKGRVRERLHSLNRQLKEGLAEMDHITLYTPMPEDLSAGMAVFDVRGMAPKSVVNRLKEKKIIGSDTPYSQSYARLTPGVFNTTEEVDNVLRAIRDLA